MPNKVLLQHFLSWVAEEHHLGVATECGFSEGGFPETRDAFIDAFLSRSTTLQLSWRRLPRKSCCGDGDLVVAMTPFSMGKLVSSLLKK